METERNRGIPLHASKMRPSERRILPIILFLAGLGLLSISSWLIYEEGQHFKFDAENRVSQQSDRLAAESAVQAARREGKGEGAGETPFVTEWMRVFISLILLGATLIVILSNKRYAPKDKHWAYATIGLVVGYWLRFS